MAKATVKEAEIMKLINIKLTAIILLLLIFIIIFSSCSTKTYIIISWSVDKNALKEAQNNLYIARLVDNNTLIAIAEKKIQNILNNPPPSEFKAKKIIDFTDKSVRFIDMEGKEKFITADKVEIQNVIKK